MKKELIDKTEGKVSHIFIPDVYDNGDFLPEDMVGFIGFDVDIDGKKIKVIKPRHSEFANLFVGDIVGVNKYIINCDYDEYVIKLREKIDIYYSFLSDKEKEIVFNKCCRDKESYDNRGLIEYDIFMK